MYRYPAVTWTTVKFWCHLWLITVSGSKLDSQQLNLHAAVTVTSSCRSLSCLHRSFWVENGDKISLRSIKIVNYCARYQLELLTLNLCSLLNLCFRNPEVMTSQFSPNFDLGCCITIQKKLSRRSFHSRPQLQIQEAPGKIKPSLSGKPVKTGANPVFFKNQDPLSTVSFMKALCLKQ